ncbi:phosphoenolpyruvate synthase [Aeromonas jandaei]|uniref:PEP-utilizing enzyme n=1 Tax=Aeromonas jandaei TaxID=650 RepID=UPI001C5B5AE2|nr:PEP-utilizing enzyme [Aeromonas jandaei]MBW3762545.1 phosphoenolpyruvate synthase [Aeromonas jandaei]
MILEFGTKAETLATLNKVKLSAKIPCSIYFSYKEWMGGHHGIIKSVHDNIIGRLIVRSSCMAEDSHSQSNAGAFLSVANVEFGFLESAIEQVFSSYGEHPDDNDQVLVQPMLEHVVLSGVAFSHDPSSCSPYRVINWHEGDNTAFITSGCGGKIWISSSHVSSDKIENPYISKVIKLIDELLVYFGGLPVDCEFAFTKSDDCLTLWLLQARPLILKSRPDSDNEHYKKLRQIADKVELGMSEHPFLMGKRTVYGVMPDWNPAEIIGLRPKPLALSLYRELITDSTWAYQRNNYGYRNLRSFPLMLHFYGMPYIDVRLSFNSFIPANLPDNVAGKLVDAYIDRLLDKPYLHDKVEFEIVYSCYTLDLHERLQSLKNEGFSEREITTITEHLKTLTNKIIDPELGLWKEDASKLDILKERRERLLQSSIGKLDTIYWLIEDTKRYGTLPFAGLARAGFIAVQFLKSLVSVGVFTQHDYDSFMNSLTTVSGQLSHDRGILSKELFLNKYGHLRPGTYDIESPRYDEAPDLYFDWNSSSSNSAVMNTPFSLTLNQMKSISALLKDHGLKPDVVGLFDFLESGIELREWSKFEFTRNLSDIIALVCSYGESLGFSKDEMSYCDISVFKEMQVGAMDSVDVIRRSIDVGLNRYKDSLKIILPPVITSPDDVWGFELSEANPNFITQGVTTGHVVTDSNKDNFSGAIIFIQSADPGYDWIFSYPIAGLVTAWGGANSHMAIRAGELGIPAIIGAGEVLFKKWSSASRITINCAAKKVDILS